jgi:hypothetical protein
VIDGREPEHIPGLDEFFMLWRNFRAHDAPFDSVREPPHVKVILQSPVLRAVQPAHALSPT